MFEKLKRKYLLLGLRGTFLCIFNSFLLFVFCKIYRFDKWHIKGNYFCRTYKRKVVELANSLKPRVVVEIGCGLGEIIKRIHAPVKYGFDIDSKAIKFAKHFNFFNKTKFFVGSFNDVLQIPEKNIDIIIMVNFIHGIQPFVLKNFLTNLLLDKKIKYIIIDRYTLEYLEKNKITSEIFLHNLTEYSKKLKKKLEVDDGGEKSRIIEIYEYEA